MKNTGTLLMKQQLFVVAESEIIISTVLLFVL